MKQAALTLGTALLWGLYDEDTTNIFNSDKVAEIKNWVNLLDGTLDGTNPVRKV